MEEGGTDARAGTPGAVREARRGRGARLVDEDEKGGRMSVAGQGRVISVSVGERGGGGVD